MSDSRLNFDTGTSVMNNSEIAEFYEGCNVLLTGGSGFVGRLLIDKLLRSCPGIQMLYLVLRSKKGKTAEERYVEFFNDVLYDRLRHEVPNFQKKVVMIDGSFDNTGLAILPKDRELIKNSHVVFHCAATVRFDNKLRFAVNINVRGTKDILLLSKQMTNLKAFVHIGTAFSQCTQRVIDEVLYDPPIECDKVLKLLDLLTDEQLEQLTPVLVSKWPNTYAFSKAIAEDVVLKYGEGLPVCIVRPSIMIPTEKEPVPGWINNFYGPTGAVVATSIGLLHTLTSDERKLCDVIPADYVVNNIIAAAWGMKKKWQIQLKRILSKPSNNDEKGDDEIPRIYNCVTSVQKPINWGEYRKYNYPCLKNTPTSKSVWFPYMITTKYRWINEINQFILHIIPGAMIDTLARLLRQKPRMLQTYKKIHKSGDVLAYFTTQDWEFGNSNVIKLWNKMSPIDRKLFYFNVNELNWSEYFAHHFIGIRTYLLKDPLDTIDKAKKRYLKLKIAHYTLITILLLLFLGLVGLSLVPVFIEG